MLNVSYKNKIGYYTEKLGNVHNTKRRVDICHANALCAMIFFTKEEAHLISFFLDLAHAKNCIKGGILNGCDNFVFYAKQCDGNMWKLIRLLADNGKKVTIR